MKGSPYFAFTLNILTLLIGRVSSSAEYMLSVPQPIALPYGYETRLTCEMNIRPDRFQWKFYPSADPYNPKIFIDLSNAPFHLIPETNYTNQGRKSLLTLLINSERIAGDYQCLAYYGVCAVASVPWSITLSHLDKLPIQQNISAQMTVGNTVSWRCLPPMSNPDPVIDYYKNGRYITSPFSESQTLVLQKIDLDDSGFYGCSVSNTLKAINTSSYFNLTVERYGPQRAPYFIIEPKKTYTVKKGDSVFLECAGVGNPTPKISWQRRNGQLPPNRFEILDGGIKIVNVTAGDDGIYSCNATNIIGSMVHFITLIYHEEPTINCNINTTDIKQGEHLELDCQIKGVPEPKIHWFINGFSVNNDSSIEPMYNKIRIKTVEKRHAGNLQIFARNSVKTVYSSITIRVIPLTYTDTIVPPPYKPKHRGKISSTRMPSKHTRLPKLIPPSKPTISRLNDETVVVRWSVPHNTGLDIQFFKVQYRELGPASQYDSHNRAKGSRWKTTNADIPPNIKDYDVTNLKPDHIYRFRIAAVYINDDNKLSPTSDRFHLKRLDFDDKNPLPIPLITHTELVNTSSVKVFWTCPKSDNTSINGFYISYMSAFTAGDYMKATIDGEDTREYVITHLQPDTVYDIKLQSFNSKFASEFSPIMKARTEALQPQSTTVSPSLPNPNNEKRNYNFYIILVGAIVVISLVVITVVMMFVCRKWKSKKADTNDKVGEDERHMQEGNEYVVGQKTITRSNGCGLNKITITTNPLADADNKNQNMIAMSCLASQNNNFSATLPESSSSKTKGKADLKSRKRN